MNSLFSCSYEIWMKDTWEYSGIEKLAEILETMKEVKVEKNKKSWAKMWNGL